MQREEDISRPSSLWKASSLPKKELASQNTVSCPDCGDVCEELIAEDWIKCGQGWRADTGPVRVVKELVIVFVVLPGPVPALTRLDVRQYALYTSSLQ